MAVDAVLIGARGTSAVATVTTTSGTSTGGSGNHGILFCSFDPATTNNTPTDSKSNTWTILGTVDTHTARSVVYTSLNWTGGASHTATMTFSANAFPTLHMIEVTGALSSTPIDIDVSTLPSSIPYTLATGTLAQANEVVLGYGTQNSINLADHYVSSTLTILSEEPNASSFWTSGVGKVVVASTSTTSQTLSKAPSYPGSGATGTEFFRLISFKAAAAADILMGQACL